MSGKRKVFCAARFRYPWSQTLVFLLMSFPKLGLGISVCREGLEKVMPELKKRVPVDVFFYADAEGPHLLEVCFTKNPIRIWVSGSDNSEELEPLDPLSSELLSQMLQKKALDLWSAMMERPQTISYKVRRLPVKTGEEE